MKDAPEATQRYAEIIFNKPLKQSFTYLIPDALKHQVEYGKRVLVPFGRVKELMGYVIQVHTETPKFPCKEIESVYDDVPLFDEEIVEFASWMSKYYLCSLGEALATYIPKETSTRPFQLPAYDNTELAWPPLNAEQHTAVKKITQAIDRREFQAYLLYGVTGSGKTEIYKRISKKVIRFKKQVLILFPEIILSSQTIGRFQKAFNNRMTVLHSKLSKKERFYNWKAILNHEVDIILGVRSALFCPPQQLGLIILDEEHDSSYKSADTPRYHARQLAYKICRDKKIPLVLGSATPSIESMYHAQKNTLTLLTLHKKHSVQQTAHLIDMKKEASHSLVSQKLLEALYVRLQKKEQSMILLNKRGHSSVLLCLDCGKAHRCPRCDISLTFHKARSCLICHYCNYSHQNTRECPYCRSDNNKLLGHGIEQVEEALMKVIPKARVTRMDLDTTQRKGAHDQILQALKNKDIDILIGTQMIAKGLHFPNVTLVGVILADIGLHIPDFRAHEKSFALLTQIIGRTGRGELPGEAIIQSYLPEHYVIQSALTQDYQRFYTQEIQERQEFGYPPFVRIVKLLIRGQDESAVIEASQSLLRQIQKTLVAGVEVLGPSAAPLRKLNKNYRWQIILKSASLKPLLRTAQDAQSSLHKHVYLEIDVDPISMM